MMQNKKAFTLIELLVVIAILAILAGILFPVFASARAKGRQTSCLSNINQISRATMMYVQDNKDCFFTYGSNAQQDFGHRFWPFIIKPYISGKPSNWNDNTVNVFVCPQDRVKQYISDGSSRFIAANGYDKLWGLTIDPAKNLFTYWCSYAVNQNLDLWPRLVDWEAPAESFLFLEGNDSDINGEDFVKMTCDDLELRYSHQGGSNYAYLDGHVQWQKAVFNGNPCLRTSWTFPPPGYGGYNDRGPWTAPAND